MTVRYVGPGGNDVNNGDSWATRKLTLNGVEDTPVAAGDVVYVGPGVYREMLTVDVSGSSGSPITYIGDVTGEHTDGVGGIVRITGSNNDQTSSRTLAITAASKNYRTFSGLYCDLQSAGCISTGTAVTGWTISDCSFLVMATAYAITFAGGTILDNTVRRCIFNTLYNGASIRYSHTSTVDNSNSLIENCIFNSGMSATVIASTRVGGITVNQCTFWGGTYCFRVPTSPAAGQTVTVQNCIMMAAQNGMYAVATGFIIEDYNTYDGVNAPRTNTDTGANSVTYPALCKTQLIRPGIQMPPVALLDLGQWSTVKHITGATGMATDDLYGITRPTTDSKKSWGAIQYSEPIRETTTTYDTSYASLKLDDAGVVQFVVPVTATSTTIAVRCYREADYAGTNPTMIIKQPGQADRTVTDAGSAATWNALTDTFTPAASPPYVIVELQSLNTATSGNYDAFFDALAVS